MKGSLATGQLTPFAFEGHEFRFIGEGIVAPDLAKALAYRAASDLTRLLDDDEKGYSVVRTPGGDQRVTTITEAGFYRACAMRQVGYIKDPTARDFVKRFQRWVAQEVLPSIRKTGSYAVEQARGLPQDHEEALLALVEAERERKRQVKAREAIESYARELEPKADSYDQSPATARTALVLPRRCSGSRRKLFAELRNLGILIAKGAMANTPCQRYMHHFVVKAYDYVRADGTTGTSYTTRVQVSGLDFLARKLGRAIQPEVIPA